MRLYPQVGFSLAIRKTRVRITADPVHLMRLFGISDATAMKYVYTAHPERQSRLPR
jgi:hypothetical protein